jgi:hypothetical protein
MLIKNTNERFGECGTFEAGSIDEVMDEMDGQIVTWTRERAAQLNDAVHNGENPEDAGLSFDEMYAQVRDEFRAGLVTVEPEGVKVGGGW